MSKILVTYFSASGVTAKAAYNLAEMLKADISEIKPKIMYSHADLNWNDRHSRSTLEMNNPNARPELAAPIDIAAYDTIFVGFPIWFYTAPRIINTFLESADFTGKKVYLFATSGGSGLGKTVETLRKIYPSIVEGKMLNRRDVDEMKHWADKFI